MKKYYLPLYTPIFQSKNLICVGFPHIDNKYCEFEYERSIYNEIENIILNGIDSNNISPTVQTLLNKNLLTSQMPNSFYNRGHLFLEYLGNNNFDEEVKNCPILIFGAGAIGATLTYLLAQFGFINICVADFDVVEESDILKTMVYDKRQKGKQKTIALSDRIFENFNVNITPYHFNSQDYNSIKSIIDTVKPVIIVKACDPDLIFRVNLNKICNEKNIPHLHIAYSFEDIKIGPFYIPEFSGCDNCMDLKIQEIYGEKYAFSNHTRLFRDLLVHPSVSFNINIASNLALKEIIFFLSGKVEYCFSIGRLAIFNGLSLEPTFTEIETNIHCPICKN